MSPVERFYGRRSGHKLRPRRRGLLASAQPLLVEAPQEGVCLDPRALFGRPIADLWLEVGFGGGEHLAFQAETHPDIGLIGCEPFINGVASLLDHVERSKLHNVRILPDDARPLIDALPEASLGRAFLLFPDPWPKRRHAERRFVSPRNLARLSRVLKDGAELRVASDDVTYIRWVLDFLPIHPDFEWMAQAPSDWRERPQDWPQTRYEAKALAQGRTPYFLRFRRIPRQKS